MSSSSQQADAIACQNDLEENVAAHSSDSLSGDCSALWKQETETSLLQTIEHTDVGADVDASLETLGKRRNYLDACGEPDCDFSCKPGGSVSNDDVLRGSINVSETNAHPVVDNLELFENSSTPVSSEIRRNENIGICGVSETNEPVKVEYQESKTPQMEFEREPEGADNYEDQPSMFSQLGAMDHIDGEAQPQEEVEDGGVYVSDNSSVHEDSPLSSNGGADIVIHSSSGGRLTSDDEGGASDFTGKEDVPCVEEGLHMRSGPFREVTVAGPVIRLGVQDGSSQDAQEAPEESDIRGAPERSISEDEAVGERNAENMSFSAESRAKISNAEKLTLPASPIILKAKRDEDADLSEVNPLLNRDPTVGNTEEMRKHVALSMPTNKVAAAFLRAQSRMRQVQEEEKGGYLSKSFWTSTVLGFRRLREWLEGISLWSDRIQAVEGKHGSNVSLILYFLRWTLLLNVLLLALWVGMSILPFIVHPPQTFSWSIFTESTASELIQGYGLDRTWFLYGGYNYPAGARFGGWYWYQPEIAFPLAIAGMYGASFFAVLYVIWRRMSGSGDASAIEQNQTYPFSSVVFASWDFHLRHKSAARTLQSAIRKQIKEMLQDATWDEMRLSLSQKLTKGMTKIIGTLVLWPMTVALTAAALYYIILEGEVLNEYFGTGFAQSIAITVVSMISQIAVRSTVKYEGWHPRITQQVEAMKLFSVKTVNLGVILYQLYSIQKQATEASKSLSEQIDMVASETEGLAPVTSSPVAKLTETIQQLEACDLETNSNVCKRGFTCCHESCTTMLGNQSLQDHCVPVCEENEMGLIFYRLILTNGIIISFQELVTTFFMSRIIKRPPEMDGSKFFVNIIETQALVWLGSPSAPLLPFFGVLSNVLTFYLKTWMALRLHNPPSNTCSASRSSNILYTLMLVTLLLCSVPMSTTFSRERDICGPHKGHTMAWAVSEKVRNAPNWIKSVIYWVTNPMILGGLVMLLLFSLLFQIALKNRWRKSARDYKGEFTKYRRDMQAKMVESRRTTNRNTPAASMNSSFASTRHSKLRIQTAESYTPLAKPKKK